MTTGAGSRIFLDTNVAIYAAFPASPWHARARLRLEQLSASGAQFVVSRQILREFLAVATRPGFITPPPALPEILTAVAALATLPILDEDGEVTRLLFELVRDPGARGRQVHDANLVATLRCHGVEYLLTHDTADFGRYRRWITVLPLEVP